MGNKFDSKALEELIKANMCESENAKTIVGCAYINRTWCPRNCKYAHKVDNKPYDPTLSSATGVGR
ncbi:hypothetical protein LCGC14_3111530 [marine sediment metagenome]|uniref:Uncharacterized protein n=1 Tax=marine sediment metagenome TaxID=412755 RepID=A0A0F8W597_9ZZZZ